MPDRQPDDRQPDNHQPDRRPQPTQLPAQERDRHPLARRQRAEGGRQPTAEGEPLTGEQLQMQSRGALGRIVPLMEGLNMSIRQERATDESIQATCDDLKEINATFLDIQAQLLAGLPA